MSTISEEGLEVNTISGKLQVLANYYEDLYKSSGPEGKEIDKIFGWCPYSQDGEGSMCRVWLGHKKARNRLGDYEFESRLITWTGWIDCGIL